MTTSEPASPAPANRLIGSLGSALLTVVPALVVVLIIIGLILTSIGKDPGTAISSFLDGALGSPARRSDVLMTALPLLLNATGLLLTFTAGLWNIGVEGQMTMGAIFATRVALWATPDTSPLMIITAELIAAMVGGALWATPDTSPLMIITAELIAAMVGGALWAGLTALLKTRGNVNEIFGGVALNFIASNILIYLLTGPWKSGSYPQTATFADTAMLPRLSRDISLSIPAVALALLAFAIVFFILRGTRWGLQLKAMGRSERSAFLLGVRTERNILLSMMFCGALAGIAGAFVVISPLSRGRLVSGVSGGLGFLGVLIVMLVNVQAPLVPLVALFFAIIPVGTLKLQNSMSLDPSLGNVFQDALVLAVLLANGIRWRISTRLRAKES